jgi:D-amino-acid dehydrogenase
MQVAVIGGGVVGVCTAYFLAEAGHEVVVLERHNNVAEQASFGNAGIIASGDVPTWAAPGMSGKVLSYLFQTEAPVKFSPTMSRAFWRWVGLWMRECRLERFRTNKERMQRVVGYSRDVLHDLRTQHELDYESTQGYLQLFRDKYELQLAEPALALLADSDTPYRLVDGNAAREIEPGLSEQIDLAGGIHLPQGESGNCPLFTKQLKVLAQKIGVSFQFNADVKSLRTVGQRIALDIGEQSFQTDAVVLAAGVDSAALLATLGLRVPLYPVKGYSATAQIRDFDEAPRSALMDEAYKVGIVRMGSRIRIAGTAELGAPLQSLRDASLRTLIKVGNDWFPNAANYHSASFWCGARPMLPDGAPLLGPTPINNVYLNIGHGANGWAMAPGSGKILADIISNRTPEIDMTGLTIGRYT